MFSNITEVWNNDPVKEMTDKLSKNTFRTKPQHEIFNFKNKNVGLSDAKSISLASENLTNTNSNSYSNSYIPENSVNFREQNLNKYLKKYQPKSYNSESEDDFKCDHNIKHLKKCKICYNKLKQFINSKINKKFDEIILDNKMKQLKNMVGTSNIYPEKISNNNWKEILIIVAAIVIIIFIILMATKIFYK
ncbi:MAG: hypothetical protein Satyrvirus13_4 [Satyrvirus sp.]|uniref:Uncharacterized protein n=1 Tax=Satyrvirus sp. TaxID=2487771 RepID=A0A3G5AGE7_9VIRU|nr:MAG: hypothetical protein Satyrvirus13_4 [Satyrvirus sp.]